VSLFVPILAGLYVRRASTPEALVSIGAGVVVMASVHLTTGGRGVGGFTPALLGLMAALAGFLIVLLARR
jgi:Na+/pantothenate symporter